MSWYYAENGDVIHKTETHDWSSPSMHLCSNCKQPATKFCDECGAYSCDDCSDLGEWECG